MSEDKKPVEAEEDAKKLAAVLRRQKESAEKTEMK